MKNIPPCPHCGEIAEFITSGQFRDNVSILYDSDGGYVEAPTRGSARITSGKKVKCYSCGKVRRDVIVSGLSIRVKPE